MSLQSTEPTHSSHGRRYAALGRLALGVAHDFNNILTIVLGLSAFLRQRTPAGLTISTELAEIERACARGAALTTQLLALQPDGGVSDGPRLLHPQDALTRLQPLLLRALGEQVRLDMHFDPDLEFVEIDPEELADLLLHAASMGSSLLASGGLLRIEASPEPAAPGAPARILFRVTLAGEAADGATDERLRLDLRLPVAARSLELARGEEPGAESALGAEGFRVAGPLARTTVLLVEDDDGLRRLCMRILEDRGFWVTTAFDGADALAACEQRGGAFDLLVTDCVLPGMHGTDLWAALSARYPMPAVFVTGYSTAAFAAREQTGLPSIVVAKPFAPEELVGAIRHVLEVPVDPASRSDIQTRDEVAIRRLLTGGVIL